MATNACTCEGCSAYVFAVEAARATKDYSRLSGYASIGGRGSHVDAGRARGINRKC